LQFVRLRPSSLSSSPLPQLLPAWSDAPRVEFVVVDAGTPCSIAEEVLAAECRIELIGAATSSWRD